MSHAAEYFAETRQITERIDYEMLEHIAQELADLRARGGRLFVLGVGGSAANCSHAVNDFRKLCGIEAYTPVDNVAELTARTNDEGWETVFAAWLGVSGRTTAGGQMPWVNLGIAGVTVSALADGLWVLTGRRTVREPTRWSYCS